MIRLIAVGDIHLGRRPRRIPDQVAAVYPPHTLSPAEAWKRTVQLALLENVDAVLLAGDVVDREDDYFEAYGLLEQGVRELVEAGIPVLGVAGNHDVEVLPRLAGAISGFKLLGANGRWEAHQIHGRGARAGTLRVVGWSFPTPRYSESPLSIPSASTVFSRSRDTEPVIGLLHCDRDGGASTHAPVSSSELAAAGVDAWLLGHLHVPDLSGEARPSGYLGSLVGLDPTETGDHGPWLVEVTDLGVRATHLPNAPLRWETVTVSCNAPEQPLRDGGSVREWLERVLPVVLEQCISSLPEGHHPDAVGCRVRIEGRTSRRAELERLAESDNIRELWQERGGVVAFVDKVTVATEPDHRMEVLALGTDPVGLMAAKVLVLQRAAGDPERRRLLEEARTRLAAVRRRRAFRALSDAESLPGDEALAARLRESALRSIDLLLAQMPGSGSQADTESTVYELDS